MERQKCAVCDKAELFNLFKLDNCPVQCCCVDEFNDDYIKDKLSYSQCQNCNTIQLDKLISLNILYSKSHNLVSVGKIWEEYFILFHDTIKKKIINKNVLEVGCPSGKIANRCSDYNKWFIVEPNKNESIILNDKITFIKEYFDNYFTITENIDIIIHSHLFEHIYEPNDFLRTCFKTLNVGGEMIFGVPNMQYLAETGLCLFNGVFFEHTIFLNKENITFLLNKNGFIVLNIVDYTNHSTIYHTKKMVINENITCGLKITNYHDVFFNTLNKYRNFVEKCNSILLKSTKKKYIFGASVYTQILLCLGLDFKKLHGILDNSKEKINNYLYGFNLLVFDPRAIENEDCVVILKNGFYVNEISIQLKSINSNTEIIS